MHGVRKEHAAVLFLVVLALLPVVIAIFKNAEERWIVCVTGFLYIALVFADGVLWVGAEDIDWDIRRKYKTWRDDRTARRLAPVGTLAQLSNPRMSQMGPPGDARVDLEEGSGTPRMYPVAERLMDIEDQTRQRQTAMPLVNEQQPGSGTWVQQELHAPPSTISYAELLEREAECERERLDRERRLDNERFKEELARTMARNEQEKRQAEERLEAERRKIEKAFKDREDEVRKREEEVAAAAEALAIRQREVEAECERVAAMMTATVKTQASKARASVVEAATSSPASGSTSRVLPTTSSRPKAGVNRTPSQVRHVKVQPATKAAPAKPTISAKKVATKPVEKKKKNDDASAHDTTNAGSSSNAIDEGVGSGGKKKQKKGK